MPWFKIDDGFPTSKPVLRIPRRHRTSAIGLWTLAGAWSAKELTDGHIATHLIEEFSSTTAMARQLVACGLWEVADNGWMFRHWAKYQPTREQVLTDREREAERKRKYRESKNSTNLTAPSTVSDSSPNRSVAVSTTPEREVGKSTNTNGRDADTPSDLHEREMSQRDTSGTPAGRTVGHHPESEHPDPTRPDPTRPLSTSTAIADAIPRGFEEFWGTYDKKRGRKNAVAKFRLAIKKPGVTAEMLTQAASEYVEWQRREGKHPAFTKDPATWLNGEHWADERVSKAKPKVDPDWHLK